MAAATTTKPQTEETAAPVKHKRNLLPAIIVAVALLAAAFVLKGGSSKAATAAPGATTTTTAEEGSVVPLDPITVNLADGHLLKVGIAVQLSKTAKAPTNGETPEAQMAKALDEAISLLGHSTYDQLIDPSQRDKVKGELSKQVRDRYDGDVLGIYFTEFVMQ